MGNVVRREERTKASTDREPWTFVTDAVHVPRRGAGRARVFTDRLIVPRPARAAGHGRCLSRAFDRGHHGGRFRPPRLPSTGPAAASGPTGHGPPPTGLWAENRPV